SSLSLTARLTHRICNSYWLYPLEPRERNPLSLKLQVNATPQLARYFVLARRRGAHLHADDDCRPLETLHSQHSRAIHQSLRPGTITPQVRRGGLQRSHGLFDGQFWRQGHVDKSLRPVTAQIRYRAKLSVCDGDQRALWIADHRAPQG